MNRSCCNVNCHSNVYNCSSYTLSYVYQQRNETATQRKRAGGSVVIHTHQLPCAHMHRSIPVCAVMLATTHTHYTLSVAVAAY
jgi:hypothetical protein